MTEGEAYQWVVDGDMLSVTVIDKQSDKQLDGVAAADGQRNIITDRARRVRNSPTAQQRQIRGSATVCDLVAPVVRKGNAKSREVNLIAGSTRGHRSLEQDTKNLTHSSIPQNRSPHPGISSMDSTQTQSIFKSLAASKSIFYNRSRESRISHDSNKIHCPKHFLLSLFLFFLISLETASATDLRLRGQAFAGTLAKKKTSTQDSTEAQRQQSPPDWAAQPEMTPPSSPYYGDDGAYMDMADGGYNSHGRIGDDDDMINGDELYQDGRLHRDRSLNGRQSTFLISLIVVVSVVAGCGATIVILGYYCQLCC